MTAEKFSSGAFVFARTRGLEPRSPDELAPLALQHGIETSFIPTYPGDRTAITRAITHASRGLANEGFLLRPIRRTSTEVTYGVVREQKDESHQRLDHDFEDTVAWSAEPDPAIVTGDHDIASRVRDAYKSLRGKIVADDWSSSITNYLESHDAARMRGDGRVYWVPPQRVVEVRTLSRFLGEVGIDLIMCEIEPETSMPPYLGNRWWRGVGFESLSMAVKRERAEPTAGPRSSRTGGDPSSWSGGSRG